MRNSKNNLTRIVLSLLFTMLSVNTFSSEQVKSPLKTDKSGTNPINFQREARIYNEYSWLNTQGDGNQSFTTMEFRTPFAGGKWQFKLKAHYNSIEADLNNDGHDDINDSGIGDFDLRFLTVPFLDMENKQAFAVALEVFVDTASEDSLGTGTTSLGPQMFYVKFFKNGLFSPALQYKFSIDEDKGRDKIDQVLIDLYFMRMAEDKQSWFLADPQIVIDNETNKEFSIVDFEFGWMMSKWWPEMKGHSFHIRPGVGIGTDRPMDGSIEVGYRIIGW